MRPGSLSELPNQSVEMSSLLLDDKGFSWLVLIFFSVKAKNSYMTVGEWYSSSWFITSNWDSLKIITTWPLVLKQISGIKSTQFPEPYAVAGSAVYLWCTEPFLWWDIQVLWRLGEGTRDYGVDHFCTIADISNLKNSFPLKVWEIEENSISMLFQRCTCDGNFTLNW